MLRKLGETWGVELGGITIEKKMKFIAELKFIARKK